MLLRIFLLMFFICGFGTAQTLPNFFSDDMVLQQKDSVPFWGTDEPEQIISITTSWGEQASARAKTAGEWKTQLSTPKAGGPYNIYITGSGKDTLKNVLIGEVWLAAGQSNMHIPLKGYRNTPIESAMRALANSKNSNIRFFRINRNPTLSPDDDVTGEWKESSPANAKEFSAIGYFFCRTPPKITGCASGKDFRERPFFEIYRVYRVSQRPKNIGHRIGLALTNFDFSS